MRFPIPPGWRAAAAGAGDPWALAALAAAVVGVGWLLSPVEAGRKLRQQHDALEGPQPNATGRALGYTGGMFANRVQDPVEVLAMRAAVQRAGSAAPEYRAGSSDFFRPYHRLAPKVTWPLATANYNLLAAQRPFRGRPIQASPGVAITAADVLTPGGGTGG